jgi:hypothetical protein
MARHGMGQDVARADIDPDTVMDVADRGPTPGST